MALPQAQIFLILGVGSKYLTQTGKKALRDPKTSGKEEAGWALGGAPGERLKPSPQGLNLQIVSCFNGSVSVLFEN